jgi:ElaB/YqjD/DUF883 family membrane-anchored ribosome-binding protein
MQTTGMQGSIQGARENVAGTIDHAADTAHQAVDRVADVASSAAEQWSAKSEELLAMKDRAMESTRGYVRENPLIALGIALALGILLARITR